MFVHFAQSSLERLRACQDTGATNGNMQACCCGHEHIGARASICTILTTQHRLIHVPVHLGTWELGRQAYNQNAVIMLSMSWAPWCCLAGSFRPMHVQKLPRWLQQEMKRSSLGHFVMCIPGRHQPAQRADFLVVPRLVQACVLELCTEETEAEPTLPEKGHTWADPVKLWGHSKYQHRMLKVASSRPCRVLLQASERA